MSVNAVAKKARVSPATVSRVINQSNYVSEETASRVHDAMQAVGYNPPAVRRGRRSHKSQGIRNGTIVFLSVHRYSPEEMFKVAALPAFLGGIQNTANNHGLDLVLAHAPDGKFVPPILARNQADGVILFGYKEVSPALAKALNGMPGVWSFRSPIDVQSQLHPQHKFDHVFYDNAQVGVIAADYLLDRRHRNVAFAALSSGNPAVRVRRETFLNRVSDQNLKVQVVTAEGSDNMTHKAQQIVEQLLAANPRPTGVFVPRDEHMLSLFNVLRHRGIEPGRDIELIGCNNDPQYMNQMHPRPATVDIMTKTVGHRSVEQLLWRMAHPTDPSRVEIFIPPELVPPDGGGAAEINQSIKKDVSIQTA